MDRRKIDDYCLDPDHEEGFHKARLFQALLGLNRDNAQRLVDLLRRAVETGDATEGVSDEYGRRYVVDFEFEGPRGPVTVRSAWIVRTGEELPRLVTCYIG